MTVRSVEVACVALATVPTPIGVVTVEATDRGLLRVWFPRRDGSPARRPAAGAGTPSPSAQSVLATAVQQIAGYFAGTRRDFDLPIDWGSVTGFRLRVLELIRNVGFGQVTTYGALATLAGEPGGGQAVGQVMGSNPVPIVVPCHRVLAADGLGGFGGGIAIKQWLLGWEGVLPMQLDVG